MQVYGGGSLAIEQGSLVLVVEILVKADFPVVPGCSRLCLAYTLIVDLSFLVLIGLEYLILSSVSHVLFLSDVRVNLTILEIERRTGAEHFKGLCQFLHALVYTAAAYVQYHLVLVLPASQDGFRTGGLVFAHKFERELAGVGKAVAAACHL